MNQNRNGFSLAELMVAMSVAVVVAIVVSVSIAGSLSAWTHINTNSSREISALGSITAIERDIASAFSINSSPFEGTENTMSFALSEKKDPFSAASPGIVEWSYNANDKKLTRSFKLFSVSAEFDSDVTIYSGIEYVSFSYLDNSPLPDDKNAVFQTQWSTPGTNIYPAFVSVDINGFSKYARIMVSGRNDEEERVNDE